MDFPAGLAMAQRRISDSTISTGMARGHPAHEGGEEACRRLASVGEATDANGSQSGIDNGSGYNVPAI